jgi:hypothetical protein
LVQSGCFSGESLFQEIKRHLLNRRRRISRLQSRSQFWELNIIKFFIVAIISIVISSPADADPKRHYVARHLASQRLVTCDGRGCSDQSHGSTAIPRVANASDSGIIVGRRPAGCPSEFCGCEASLYVFGEIRPELNLASNWARKFSRASPAPGMAAVRNHHVVVLMSHVEGNDWLVHDGNSGGGLTRDHVMSIRGHIIVDPRGSRSAEQQK